MEMVKLGIPEGLDMSVGEAMFTQRAIRRFDASRPIEDEHIKLILDAASKAPSGGNSQPARYLVLRDRVKILAFGELYHEAWWAKRRDEFDWKTKEDIPEDSVYRMPALLADEIVNAPLIILAFSTGGPWEAMSVLPGIQNMLLAARALGIGSVLTTLHPDVLQRVYSMFDVPENVTLHHCLPFGYPRGRFGPTSRYPTANTTYWDVWGQTPHWE